MNKDFMDQLKLEDLPTYNWLIADTIDPDLDKDIMIHEKYEDCWTIRAMFKNLRENCHFGLSSATLQNTWIAQREFVPSIETHDVYTLIEDALINAYCISNSITKRGEELIEKTILPALNDILDNELVDPEYAYSHTSVRPNIYSVAAQLYQEYPEDIELIKQFCCFELFKKLEDCDEITQGLKICI